MGRKSETLRPEWILNTFPDFYRHISNLCISYFIYASAGYVWLMMGMNLKSIILLGVIIIIANFVYELFIPVLNSLDIVDAWYGVAGTLAGFIFLFLAKKFGMKANKDLRNDPLSCKNL